MQEKVFVTFDGDYLNIQPGPIASPPNVECFMNYEGGELRRGRYYYAVTSIGVNGESRERSILDVVAKFPNNIIYLSWERVPFVTEYRVYRGTEDPGKLSRGAGPFDGFLSVMDTEVFDTGTIQLNEYKKFTPGVTDPPDCPHVLHRNVIRDIDWTNDTVARVIIRNIHNDLIFLDLRDILNQPTWYPRTNEGILKAFNDLTYWWKHGSR